MLNDRWRTRVEPSAFGYVRAIEIQYDIFAIEFQYDIFGGNKLPGLLVIHVLRTHDVYRRSDGNELFAHNLHVDCCSCWCYLIRDLKCAKIGL